MIVEIEAKFACDDCGTEFFVQLDPAQCVPDGWSVFAIAEDAIRGGGSYRDGDDHPETPWGIGSVDNDRHLCARCTKKNDAANPEIDHYLDSETTHHLRRVYSDDSYEYWDKDKRDGWNPGLSKVVSLCGKYTKLTEDEARQKFPAAFTEVH